MIHIGLIEYRDIFQISARGGDWPGVLCLVPRDVPLSDLLAAGQGRHLLEEADGDRGDPDICEQTHPGLRCWLGETKLSIILFIIQAPPSYRGLA